MCRANVHHRQCCTARTHAACNRYIQQLQTTLQFKGVRQGLPRCAIQENRPRREQGKAVSVFLGNGHQGRCHLRHHQRIQAHYPQSAAFAVGDGVGRHLKHRAGHGNLRVVGHAFKHRFVKAALGGTQFQVGLAVHRPHGRRKLRQRRRVDQMRGKRQRHTQHDSHHSRRVAPRVMGEFSPGELVQEF